VSGRCEYADGDGGGNTPTATVVGNTPTATVMPTGVPTGTTSSVS
jgi:hypothetical protein